MKSIVTAIAVTMALSTSATAQQAAARLDVPAAGRLAALALACVQKEYPNKIAHVLNSPEDIKAPHELTPAFYGCYDWHSSVHGHWLLARLVRTFPNGPFASDALAALKSNLTPARIAGEVAYLNATGRESFERPYGLAWLLQLGAELRESQTAEAAALSSALRPLEAAVIARLKAWLPKLAYPIREGEHPQTAFAFGLILDYARRNDPELAAMVTEKVREFHLKDRDCPLNYEPSGQDFLSPCIAEADVVRRVLPPAEFAVWLTKFLPRLPTTNSAAWLPIGIVTDKTDGKLAHLDGLNLSRAWMLEGIAAGLPAGDPRRRSLMAAANAHARSGLAAVTGEHYAGGHWLGSFAVYLTTRRGIVTSTASAGVAQSVPSGVGDTAMPLSVMTFNIRYAHTQPPNLWPDRLPVILDMVERRRPDIIGTQEGLYHQLVDLETSLPGYAWIGTGRDGDSKGEFMAVFYRKDRVEPLAYENYWLSDAPAVPGSRTWGNNYPRMVTSVRFRDRKNGGEFHFVNTHLDHEVQLSRERSAEMILARLTATLAGMPVILVGDFNAAARDNPVYTLLTGPGGFTDSWVAAGNADTLGTFHGFNGVAVAKGTPRIDWILSRGPVAVLSTEIVTDARNGQLPSDHFPVVARLRVATPAPAPAPASPSR